jgi:hypothetical protein
MEWQFSSHDQCSNLARKVGADTGDLVDLVRAQLGDCHRLVANRARRVVIGTHAKKVLAAKLQHLANIIEQLGDLVILHHRYFIQWCWVTSYAAMVEDCLVIRAFPVGPRQCAVQPAWLALLNRSGARI